MTLSVWMMMRQQPNAAKVVLSRGISVSKTNNKNLGFLGLTAPRSTEAVASISYNSSGNMGYHRNFLWNISYDVRGFSTMKQTLQISHSTERYPTTASSSTNRAFQQQQQQQQQRNVRLFSSYPSHQVVGLPSLSPTMESGSISSWNVSVGDSFGPGDSLCSIETDKATVDFEAQDEGVVAQILVPAGGGTEIKVGSPIMIVVEDSADVAAFANYSLASATTAKSSPPPAVAAETPPTPSAPAAPAPIVSASITGDGSRIVASPLARMLAKEMGYNIGDIVGTGPDGRIVAADVKEFVVPPLKESAPVAAISAGIPMAPSSVVIAAAPLPPPVAGAGYTDYALSESSKEVAARLMQSKRNVPHYYLTVDICMDELLKLRSTLNSNRKDDNAIGVYEFILKAAAKSMQTVPAVNASWLESVVRVYKSVDINVVVGSGDTLYTPVIRDCSTKGLSTIASELNSAVRWTNISETAAPDASVGTFTILNLGMYGIKSCAPIVREPQSCALAVGAIENRIVPSSDPDEVYKQSAMLTATMSCDHRVVDGAVGAQWLSTFKTILENPMTLVL